MNDHHGGATTATNRPLNAYITATNLLRCPADRGDFFYPNRTAFDAFGNSYRTQFGVNSFRTRHVTGDSLAAKDAPEARPIKVGMVGAQSGQQDHPRRRPVAWQPQARGSAQRLAQRPRGP